jgi:23S rRNA maturation-related 3'-5' exoribonuclease YhaM
MSEKYMVFQKELDNIKDDSIRSFVVTALKKLPDYFYEVPASSGGKYHPSYASGEGGLVRHTIAATRIAVELFRMGCFTYSEQEKDIILASLILHDGCKSGLRKSQYTVTEHPLIVAKFVKEDEEIKNCVSEEVVNLIASCIESHMGIWNYDYKTKKEVLPKPSTKLQHFVHWCDYLASRKCLEFNFDVNVVRD